MATQLYWQRRLLMAAACIAVIHGVFLYGLADWLWGRAHYQFFPLVIIGAAALGWTRLSETESPPGGQVTVRIVLLTMLAVLLLTCAVALNSNWLGAFSAIITIWTAIWLLGGTQLSSNLKGPVFFLLLAVPLPINLDLKLIIWLQKVASAAASSLLDMQRIRNQISGVAISNEHKDFLVEEACSGVHSLFSSLCVVVFLCVVQKYGLLRILANISQTVAWVIVANTLRVFIIIFSESRWQLGLDSGWRHELLGIFTYSVVLLFAFSGDRLLNFVVPFGGKTKLSADGHLTENDSARRGFVKRIGAQVHRLNDWLNNPIAPTRVSLRLAAATLLCVFLPLSTASYASLLTRATSSVNATTQQYAMSARLLERITSESLTAEANGWSLTNVEQIARNEDDPLGTNSVVFTYSGNGLTAKFSVDGFYSEWHDLAYCYTSLDWQLQMQQNQLDHETELHSTELELSTNSGEAAVVYFSCFDSQIKSVVPGKQSIGVIQTLRLLMDRLPGGTSEEPQQTYSPPVFQLQLMCAQNKGLMAHEKAALKELFKQLRHRALQALTETAP